jgi:hypothetical protein
MPYKDKEKQKAAQKAWYESNKELTIKRSNSSREKRKVIVRTIKESSPCQDCGVSYPYYVMQFDHVGVDQKVANVNVLLSSSSLQSALDEIEKCELVCANCHATRTWKRQHNLDLRFK